MSEEDIGSRMSASEFSDVSAGQSQITPWPPPPTKSGTQEFLAKAVGQFVSPASLARWVVGSLVAILACDIAQNVAAFVYVITNDHLFLILDGVSQVFRVALALINIPLFLIWLHRSYKNLVVFGTEGLGCSPAWAVGYFFIPVINIFRPFAIVRELWKASDTSLSLPIGNTWKIAPSAARIGFWWWLWVYQVLVVISVTSQNTSVHDKWFELGRQSAPSLLNAAVAILAITIVRAITRRQTERGRQLTDLAQDEASERTTSSAADK